MLKADRRRYSRASSELTLYSQVLCARLMCITEQAALACKRTAANAAALSLLSC